jgi:hypothetical protein
MKKSKNFGMFLCEREPKDYTIYAQQQRNLSLPWYITSKWVLKTLTHVFKKKLNHYASNCSEVTWFDKNQLQDSISLYAQVSRAMVFKTDGPYFWFLSLCYLRNKGSVVKFCNSKRVGWVAYKFSKGVRSRIFWKRDTQKFKIIYR